MKPSETHRLKAIGLLSKLITAPIPVIEAFGRALDRQLQIENKEPDFIACMEVPDEYISAALKRAKLDDSAITDIIFISFEKNNKLKYYHHGNWKEK